jgi:N-acetylmuramoyl-L-alanine amidase
VGFLGDTWRSAALLLAAVVACIGGAAAARAEPPAAAAAATPASCNRAAFRVIVDVGHTADVPGAISARGVTEYAFNLRLAKLISERLVDAGFWKTKLLVTAAAPHRGLFERAFRANHDRADLLLSVHHDSVPAPLLESWDYEGKENRFSDRFRGHSIFVSYANRARQRSLAFARLLGTRLAAHGLRYTPHYTNPVMGRWRRELVDAQAGVYRFDDLVVLRYARMPAVLLEAGSIVNRDEELLLASAEHQGLIAEAVAEAVAGFCAERAMQRARGKRPRARSEM